MQTWLLSGRDNRGAGPARPVLMDGRYRYALDMQYSCGGFCEPIFASGKGYASSRDNGCRHSGSCCAAFHKRGKASPKACMTSCAS
jgi:hypothetical protein